MKKILGISLMAVLAATPLIASAADPTAPSSYALTDQKSGQSYDSENGTTPRAAAAKYFKGETVNAADRTNVATSSYVKGAYNAAISAVNALGKDVEDNYATKTGVIATIGEATATGSADLAVTGNVSGSATVAIPTTVNVTAVTEWGSADTTPIAAASLDTSANAATANITGTMSGAIANGAKATGTITSDVSVSQYYATIPTP